MINKAIRAEKFMDEYSKMSRLQKLFCRRVFHIMAFRLKRILKVKRITAKTFWGEKMTMPLEDSVSLSYFGTLEKEEQGTIQWLIKSLKKEDVFYDVGANFGFYTALAKQFTDNVHTFEASNGLALSDKDGFTEFYEGQDGTGSGGNTTVKEIADRIFEKYTVRHVQSMTLDTYCKTHEPPTIIKLDVEGSESKVIDGGRETLKKYHPVVIMEVWSEEHKKQRKKNRSKCLSSKRR